MGYFMYQDCSKKRPTRYLCIIGTDFKVKGSFIGQGSLKNQLFGLSTDPLHYFNIIENCFV